MIVRVGEMVGTDNASDMTFGICVHSYLIGNQRYVVLLFENGLTQEYSPDEQKLRLEKVDFFEELRYYQYKNRVHLSNNYKNGLFKKFFDKFEKKY